MTHLRFRRQRGSAALLGLFFGLAMIAVLSAVMSLAAVNVKSAGRYRAQAHARAAAESGVAACLGALRTGAPAGKLSGEVLGGRYDARCSRDGESFGIESTGTCPCGEGLALEYAVRLKGQLAADRVGHSECSVSVAARRAEP
jgi:hypothetical protein